MAGSRPALTAMGVTPARIVAWSAHLDDAAVRFAIAAPERLAAWLAQVAHESASFSAVEECLSYNAERLASVWPRRFPTVESARPFARRPAALANLVYAGRLGNGDASSGDGYRFRGRGLIQLTGRDNYRAAGVALGIDLVRSPELLLQPRHAAASAGWYWASRGCNELADIDTADAFASITRTINGGLTGYPDRAALWVAARRALELSCV